MTTDLPRPARKGGSPVPPHDRPRHRVLSNLRAIRLTARLTIAQVEAGSGVYGVSAIERGKNVNLRHAMMLARFFAVPVEAVWTFAPEAGDGP